MIRPHNCTNHPSRCPRSYMSSTHTFLRTDCIWMNSMCCGRKTRITRHLRRIMWRQHKLSLSSGERKARETASVNERRGLGPGKISAYIFSWRVIFKIYIFSSSSSSPSCDWTLVIRDEHMCPTSWPQCPFSSYDYTLDSQTTCSYPCLLRINS